MQTRTMVIGTGVLDGGAGDLLKSKMTVGEEQHEQLRTRSCWDTNKFAVM